VLTRRCQECGKEVPLGDTFAYYKQHYNVAGEPTFHIEVLVCKECFIKHLEAEKSKKQLEIQQIEKMLKNLKKGG